MHSFELRAHIEIDYRAVRGLREELTARRTLRDWLLIWLM
jgi:hypothetical protein